MDPSINPHVLRSAGDELWRLTGLRLARATQALTSRPVGLLDAGPRFLARALATPVGQRTRLQRSAVVASSTLAAAPADIQPLFPVVRALDSLIDDMCASLARLDTIDGQVRIAP